MRTTHGHILATLPALAWIACDTGTITNIQSNDDDSPDGEGGTGGPGGGSDPTASPVPMVTIDFDVTNEDLVNPERGYYVGLDLLGADASDAREVRASGHTLAIAIVRLDDYRDRALDAPLLSQLREGLAAVRSGGIKVILRFTYNASETADADRERILQHIDQLAPVMAANADVIAVVQAGFIGAWGEWHSSTHGLDNDTDRRAILRALLAAVPTSRSVQIRTPMYKDAIYPGGPLDEGEAWTAEERARVGHHNDCFLASDSDYGTFADPVSRWEDYVEQDGRFLPIGGETCALNAPKTDCDQAMAIMEAQHWSYLNREYNQAVLDGWEEQGCAGQIERRLGHRLALVEARVGEMVAPGGTLDVDLEIDNLGFSAPFNRRPIVLVLQRGEQRWEVTLEGRDARQLVPGRTTITARLRVPADAVPADDYQLALWLPDEDDRLRHDPRYAIRLASAGVWDPTEGTNTITRSLRVDPSAPGDVDPTATALVQLPR